jgi:hypothetical protein
MAKRFGHGEKVGVRRKWPARALSHPQTPAGGLQAARQAWKGPRAHRQLARFGYVEKFGPTNWRDLGMAKNPALPTGVIWVWRKLWVC